MEEKKTAVPECVFCGAPWTDDMVRVEDLESSDGCDTCGYGAYVSGTVVIACSSCGRVVYKKDFHQKQC